MAYLVLYDVKVLALRLNNKWYWEFFFVGGPSHKYIFIKPFAFIEII